MCNPSIPLFTWLVSSTLTSHEAWSAPRLFLYSFTSPISSILTHQYFIYLPNVKLSHCNFSTPVQYHHTYCLSSVPLSFAPQPTRTGLRYPLSCLLVQFFTHLTRLAHHYQQSSAVHWRSKTFPIFLQIFVWRYYNPSWLTISPPGSRSASVSIIYRLPPWIEMSVCHLLYE